MPSPKKILIVSTVYGTINSFLLPHIDLLTSMGVEVSVAANMKKRKPSNDANFNAFHVDFTRSPYKINQIFKSYKQIKELLEKESFDLIHTHTPIASFLTRMAVKNVNKPRIKPMVVYTAHGFHFFKGCNWIGPAGVYYLLEKYASKYTDLILTINREDFERAKKWTNKDGPDVKLVQGVGFNPKKFDLKLSEVERTSIKSELGIPVNACVLISVAELNNNKNQQMVIRALPGLLRTTGRDVHYIMVGKGPSKEKLERLAKKVGVFDRCHFLGYRSDVPKLLNIADIFVSCSRREGLPVSVMEAMYVGLPVVASNIRGHVDLLGNVFSEGLFMTNNLEDLINCLTKTIENTSDKKLRNSYGEKLQVEVRKYTLEEVLPQMKEIYAQCFGF